MNKNSSSLILSRMGMSYTGFHGFSLVELLIAMAVGLVVLGAMYSVFTIQNKALSNQEEIVAMQQSVRAGMDMMVREIGMAGYNPTGATTNKPRIVTAGANSITFTMDITDTDNITRLPDGLTDGPNEYITYDLYESGGVPALGRRSTSGGTRQPIVENISALTFTYGTGYKDITIELTGRAAKPDPAYSANGGYRTYKLRSVVAPRNLAD